MTASAANLDEIRNYTIEITPYEEDGSLDMTYHITWEVLDSTSEGPMDWVKIGIPNRHVEDIEALSDNIEKISYYNDGGDYIRIDFDQKYYAGDMVEFDFRFHQHQMYRQMGHNREYTFTPGWFDDIDVDLLTIRWDSDKVKSVSPHPFENDGSYYWTTPLYEGEKYTVTVIYPDEAFTSADDTKISASDDRDTIQLIFLVIIPIAFCCILILPKCRDKIGENDYYTKHKGMGSVYAPHSRSHSGGGHCACACACACAGGGRAGCSTKDFYGTKLETKKIQKALKN